MSSKKPSPTSVEIVARCGKKFSLRIRFGLTVGAIAVLVSAASKLVG